MQAHNDAKYSPRVRLGIAVLAPLAAWALIAIWWFS